MNRAITGIVVLSVFVCMAWPAFAAGPAGGIHRPEAQPTVLGTVTSIDEKKGDIMVMDENKHYEVTVHLKTQDRPKVKVGDRVRIKLERDSFIADSVIVENKAK